MDFQKYTTSKLVTSLNDAERVKCHRKNFQRLGEPPEYSSKTSTWKFQRSL